MRTAVIALLALLPAACAHSEEYWEEPEHVPAPVVVELAAVEAAPAPAQPVVVEPVAAPRQRPAAAYARRSRFGQRQMTSDQAVTIEFPAQGMKYTDLFALVSRETGIRVRYQQNNQVIRNMPVSIVGPTRIAKSDLIAWMQDTSAYDGIVVVPHGPPDRKEYAAFDMGSPGLSTSARFVPEDELPALAGRTGLYVSSVLTIPEGLDPGRVRQALSQLSTKTAGLGRVNEVDKRANLIAVSDFAAIVANMQRALDDMAIRLYESGQ